MRNSTDRVYQNALHIVTVFFSLTPSLVICIFHKYNPGRAVPYGAGWGAASPGKKDHPGSFGNEIG